MNHTAQSDDADDGATDTGEAVSSDPRPDSSPAVTFGAEPLLPTEVIFDMLSSQRRRYALRYLKQRDSPVSIRDLSEQVAAWENGLDLADVTPRERKRVYTALHQTHLPRMDKLGVVRYNRSRGVISVTDEMRAFDIYLDIVPRDAVPWGQVYLGLAAVALAFCTPIALGFGPFALVPAAAAALTVAACFLGVSIVHVIRERGLRLGASEIPRESRLLQKK